MLAFHLAVALFAHTHGRPPRKGEHAALLEAVRGAFVQLRCTPSPDPTTALAQLRASAGVKQVIDVALDEPELTSPHSFAVKLEELAQTVQKHRTFVIDGLGCLVHHKRAYYLVTERTMKRVPLAEVFAARRPCRSVIVLHGTRAPRGVTH
jgi:hypothetical protein